MALATVPDGPFFGFTAAQLTARLAVLQSYMLARTPGEGQLTSVGVNGKSFTYTPGGGLTVAAEIAELQSAMAWVDDDALRVTSEHVFAAR